MAEEDKKKCAKKIHGKSGNIREQNVDDEALALMMSCSHHRELFHYMNAGEAASNHQQINNYHPLRYGADDVWSWSRSQRSPEVRLYGPCCRIAHFHPSWSSGTAAVRGTRILNNGHYFWELHLSKRIFGTSMMFGIGTKFARLHADSFTNLLGEDIHGWALSHKGLLWHNGQWTHYTKPFRENVATRIGMYFDGVGGTLTFYKDGECLGVAFRGLHEIKEPLYPIVSSTAAKTEMLLTVMKREYVNLQDRCRTVILNAVQHNRKSVQQLCIPVMIKKYLEEEIILDKRMYLLERHCNERSSATTNNALDAYINNPYRYC